MARKARVLIATGFVENVIIADDDFTPPEGRTLIDSDTAAPGDTWDGTTFTRPAPVPPDPDPDQDIIDAVLDKASGDVTAADVKRALLADLRKRHRTRA